MATHDPSYASASAIVSKARELWRPVVRNVTKRSAPLEPAKDRLAALIRETQRDVTATALQYVPAVITGAAEELRARGLPATSAAVVRALELNAPGGRIAIDLVDRMIRVLVGEDPKTVLARARELGARAVEGQHDGDE